MAHHSFITYRESRVEYYTDSSENESLVTKKMEARLDELEALVKGVNAMLIELMTIVREGRFQRRSSEGSAGAGGSEGARGSAAEGNMGAGRAGRGRQVARARAAEWGKPR